MLRSISTQKTYTGRRVRCGWGRPSFTLSNLQVLSGNENLEIVTVKDSLNNMLQNARFLNNITILQDFLNQPNCSVIALCDSLANFLNNNNVLITDVVAIDVLSGGDIVVFQR